MSTSSSFSSSSSSSSFSSSSSRPPSKLPIQPPPPPQSKPNPNASPLLSTFYIHPAPPQSSSQISLSSTQQQNTHPFQFPLYATITICPSLQAFNISVTDGKDHWTGEYDNKRGNGLDDEKFKLVLDAVCLDDFGIILPSFHEKEKNETNDDKDKAPNQRENLRSIYSVNSGSNDLTLSIRHLRVIPSTQQQHNSTQPTNTQSNNGNASNKTIDIRLLSIPLTLRTKDSMSLSQYLTNINTLQTLTSTTLHDQITVNKALTTQNATLARTNGMLNEQLLLRENELLANFCTMLNAKKLEISKLKSEVEVLKKKCRNKKDGGSLYVDSTNAGGKKRKVQGGDDDDGDEDTSESRRKLELMESFAAAGSDVKRSSTANRVPSMRSSSSSTSAITKDANDKRNGPLVATNETTGTREWFNFGGDSDDDDDDDSDDNTRTRKGGILKMLEEKAVREFRNDDIKESESEEDEDLLAPKIVVKKAAPVKKVVAKNTTKKAVVKQTPKQKQKPETPTLKVVAKVEPVNAYLSAIDPKILAQLDCSDSDSD